IETPPVIRIGLHPDLKALIKFVEQIDIGGTQVSLQSLKDVVHRDAQRFGHGSIDAKLKLRAFGVKGRHDTAQAGLLLRRQKNLLRHFLEAAEADTRTILHHHLKAARLSQAWYWRWNQYLELRLANSLKLFPQSGHDPGL